jgi:arylsulfatase
VSNEHTGGFAFTGGDILEVAVNIGDDVYLDLEREFAAAMARD